MGQGYGRELKRIVLASGCRFVRQGKGDHEIWYSPISDRTFTVDASVKKKYTAEASLKQAGVKERIK